MALIKKLTSKVKDKTKEKETKIQQTTRAKSTAASQKATNKVTNKTGTRVKATKPPVRTGTGQKKGKTVYYTGRTGKFGAEAVYSSQKKAQAEVNYAKGKPSMMGTRDLTGKTLSVPRRSLAEQIGRDMYFSNNPKDPAGVTERATTMAPLDQMKVDALSGYWSSRTWARAKSKSAREQVQDALQAPKKTVQQWYHRNFVNQQKLSQWDRKNLTPGQQQAVKESKAAFRRGQRAGDRASMTRAHAQAEAIRYGQGYSGGAAGDEYISPELSWEERRLLNQEGQRKLKQAKMDYAKAETQEARERAAQKGQRIRQNKLYRNEADIDTSAGWDRDAHGRRRWDGTKEQSLEDARKGKAAFQAVGENIVGGLAYAGDITRQAFRDNERTRNMESWIREARNLAKYQANLDSYNERVKRYGYDPLGESGKYLEKKVEYAQYAQTQLDAAYLDPKSAYYDETVAQRLRHRSGQQGETFGERMLRQGQEHQAEATEGLNPAEKFVTDALISTGASLPGMALGAVPVVGPALGMGVLGTQAMGQRAYDLRQQGLSSGQAFRGGLISGGIEVLTEKLPIENFAKILSGKSGRTAIKNILQQAGIEAGEESMSYLLNFVADKAQKHPDAEFTLAGLLENAGMGAIGGATLGTAGSFIQSGARNGDTMPTPSATDVDHSSPVAPLPVPDSAHGPVARTLGQASSEISPVQARGNFDSPPISPQSRETLPGVGAAQEVQQPSSGQRLQETLAQRRAELAAPAATTTQERSAPVQAKTTPAAETTPQRVAASVKTEPQRLVNLNRPGQAVAFDPVARMAETLGESGRKAIQAAGKNVADNLAYSKAFTQVYDQAVSGKTQEQIRQPAALTGPQFYAAVQSGLNDRAAGLEQERRAAKFATVQGKGSGLVYDDYVGQMDSRTADEIHRVAKALGVKVRFADQVRGGAADGQIENGVVTVERGNENPIRAIVGHELTHRVQELAPEGYRTLRDFVMQDETYRAAVDDRIERYARQGVELSREAAMDEITADYAGMLMQEEGVMRDFIHKNQGNRNLLQRILDAFRYLAAKLTGKSKQQANEAVRLLEEAMRAASEQARVLEKQGNKNTATEGGQVRYSFTKYDQHQLDNWANSKRIVIYKNENQLRQFVREAIRGEGTQRKMYFGKVPHDLAARIEQATGLNVEGFNCSLSAYEIRKIMKDHGNEAKEALRGQRAITEDDFVDIPDIIESPDEITLSDRNYMGKPGINFVKTKNGKATVFAYVSDKHLDLIVQTMFSGKKKGNLATSTDEQASVNTPEANNGTIPTTNLPQQDGNSNPKNSLEAQGNKNPAEVGGEVRYSIKTNDAGEKYVDVDIDQHLFDGLSVEEMQNVAKNEIKKRFKGKVIGTDYTAYVNKNSAEHYAYPANRRMDVQQKQDKMRASTELDHIVEASTFRENVPDDGRHPSATGGLDKLDTIFKVGGRTYSAEITVLVTDRGRVFYDLTKFKDTTRREIGQTQNRAAETSGDASMDSIFQESEKSNPKNSLKSAGGYDEARLLRENQMLRDKVEYWKSQTQRSDRTKADPKEVRKLARRLAKDYSTTMEPDEIAGQLQAIYDGIAGDWTYGQAEDAARSLAREMVEQASETDGYLYHEYAPMREFFRNTPLVVTPELTGQITDYRDFRKAMFGKLRLQNGKQANVDQVYQEISTLWPEWFDQQRDTSSLDQLERIVDVLEDIYAQEEGNPFAEDMEGPAGFLATEIMESFWDTPAVKRTFADRAEERFGRQVMKTNALRERYQESLRKAREGRDRKLQAQKEHYLGQSKARSQRQKERELRAKIIRHGRQLSQKLLKPSDKQHVPQALRDSVAKVLESINLESTFDYGPDGKRAPRGEGTATKRTEAFQALRLAYRDALSEGADLVIDPDLMDNINAVESMKDTPLGKLSLDQLTTMWKTVRAVEASITTANRMLGQQRYETVSQAAEGLKEGIGRRRDRGDYRGPVGAFDKLLNTGMLTPEAFFHRMGETGQALFKMLRSAQDKHIGIMQEAQEYTEKLVGKTKVRKLEKETHTFHFDGQTVTMSTAQIMSLYELLKRQQAVEHIAVGGIRPDAIEKGVKKKTPSEPVHLTPEHLSEIVGMLTEDQKKLADGLQQYMGGRLAELGNQASMAVYGYEKFNEKNYFPIKVDKNQTVTDQAKDAPAATIAGRGFTKATTPHANNALIVKNIFDVYADHVTDMATYSSWLEAMENLQRVYNFTFRDEDGNRTGTTKALLERAYGKNGLSYWEKLMEDLNNGVHGTNDTPFNSLVGNYKASAIGANIRVFIQQPTAILRALDDINPVDFLAGFGKARPFKWRKVKEYAPIATWKDWGYFDADTGRQMKSILFGDDSALAKLNNGLMAPAGWMDSIAWTHIWNALEVETRRKRKDLTPRSTEFYEAVAERFNEVIDHSQVVDGILQRSQVMRSADGITKMATSFMAEPTKVYNMFTTAVYDLKHAQDPKARTAAMKKLGRTTFALIASFVANAAAQSLVDGLRDDDRDEKYWEKFFQAFYGLEGDEETTGEKVKNVLLEGNLGSAFNPATYIPWAKDIVSISQGFTVSRMDMDSISKVIQAVGKCIKAANGEGSITPQNALATLIAEGSRLLGAPVANIKRDVLGVYQTVLNEKGMYRGQYALRKLLYRLDNTNNYTGFVKIAYDAKKAGDPEAYEAIREDMLANGAKDADAFDKKMAELMKKDMEDGGAYSAELDRAYGAYETMMEGNDAYQALPVDQQAKVQESLHQYAQFQVMGEVSDGEITSDNSEMLAIQAAEEAGIDPVTWKSWKQFCANNGADKDENGESIRGTWKAKKEKWLEENEITGAQAEYMMEHSK